MNSNIYSQLDSRWSSLPYPTKDSSFGGNGCGCCACLHVIIELNKYKDWTPKDLRPWMVNQGFAVRNQGTTWAGIPKTLEHFGFGAINHDTMNDIFKTLDKRKKEGKACLGVILFRGGTKGGITWTSGGHYVAFVDYKVSGDKHYFYTKDSGGRKHSGWYCYETQMKGLIPQIWSALKPGEPTPSPTPTPTPEPTPRTDTYQGEYPVVKKYLEKGDTGIQVTRLQDYIDWYYNGAFFKECGPADGKYGNNTLKWTKKMQTEFFGKEEADGLVGKKTIAEMKKRGGYKEPERIIDISEFQSTINFKKVKADGVTGVIIRCGRRGAGDAKLKEDIRFMEHIKGAYNAGLKVGIYMFTEAVNAKEGKEEAQYAISLMKKAGVPLSYPIGIDSEDVFYKENGKTYKGRANSGVLSKAKRTEAIKAFCEEIKRQGYDSMIYASLVWFSNQLDMSKLPYNVWCAQYYSKCEYKGKYIMWQYTSEAKVKGISGNVDMNYWYGK